MKSNSVCFSTVARSLARILDGGHRWGIINAFYLFLPFKRDLTQRHLFNRKIRCNLKRPLFKRLNHSSPFSQLHFDLRWHIAEAGTMNLVYQDVIYIWGFIKVIADECTY